MVQQELARRMTVYGWGNGSDSGVVEKLWVEQVDSDWLLGVHFIQGPWRYEYRVRRMLAWGESTESHDDIVSDIVNLVVDEPHGPPAWPVDADGRYLMPEAQPMTDRFAGIAEPISNTEVTGPGSSG